MFLSFVDFMFFMIFYDFPTRRENAKTKQNKRKERKRQCRNQKRGKRDLPVSNLGREVLDPLPCRRRCPGDSAHVLSHPCKVVPTEPKRWEIEEMGQPKEPEMSSSRCDQEDPSRKKRS